jgi:hypothetical protein
MDSQKPRENIIFLSRIVNSSDNIILAGAEALDGLLLTAGLPRKLWPLCVLDQLVIPDKQAELY